MGGLDHDQGRDREVEVPTRADLGPNLAAEVAPDLNQEADLRVKVVVAVNLEAEVNPAPDQLQVHPPDQNQDPILLLVQTNLNFSTLSCIFAIYLSFSQCILIRMNLVVMR